MSAYQKVYEEKRGHAAGDSDVEKQASQLASDVRYKAKGKVKPGASDEEKKKVFIQILGSSPAPQAVKSMAKQKLMGEAKEEGSMISNVSKSLIRNQRRFGDTGSTEPTGSTGQGMSSAAKMSLERQKETREKRGVKTTGPQAQTQTDKMNNSYEPEGEVIDEMRFNDGKKGTEKRKEALRKKRGLTKDQMDKHPQFKTEGASYGITRGSGTPSGAMAAFGKAPRRQKGAMAYDGPNKETTEAADRIIAKTKAKRKKTRKEEVELGEMKMKSKPKNPKDMSKGVEQKAPVDYRTLAQSHVPVGNIFNEKKMDPVGQEDGDINNDGKKDGTDKYLMNRRKAISKAIGKKRGRVKEGFSAWRIDLDFNEQVKK